MIFASRVFRIAGVLGVVVMLPMYFLERRYGIEYPPAVTHPEFYYGFAGVVLACQVMFLIISVDPVRYRPMMIVGIVEKLSYSTAVILLILTGRAPAVLGVTAALDMTLGVLFAVAFVRTPGYGQGSLDRAAGLRRGGADTGPGWPAAEEIP